MAVVYEELQAPHPDLFFDLDIPIYRYMKWEYLHKFYSNSNHEWILARPCLWQDKFEHFIFKCEKFHSNKMDMNINVSNLADQYYAQCWTIVEESSMQWQINKPTLIVGMIM